MSSEVKSGSAFEYANGRKMKRAWNVLGTIAGLWALASVVYLWPSTHLRGAGWFHDLFSASIVVTWTIGPAAWFAIEYHHYLTDDEKNDPKAMRRFNQGQKLTRNLWVGIGVLLAALYFDAQKQSSQGSVDELDRRHQEFFSDPQ